MTGGTDELFLPQLVEKNPGVWSNQETDIREAAVDLVGRQARVPRAHTEAQMLARQHEMGHVKYSPKDIMTTAPGIMAQALALGLPPIDTVIALRLAKMLEETRVDSLLWRNHGIDDRPARESLDWSKMTLPDDPVYAVEMVLQLAWTCWESVGVSVPDAPPSRVADPGVKDFFSTVWNSAYAYNPEILRAIIQACTRMYEDPTHEARDRAAAELASFFPVTIPDKDMQPKAKPEQQRAEAEAEREEAEIEAERRKDKGERTEEPEILLISGEDVVQGKAEIHDHTLGIRRTSLRIARRDVPQFTGTRLVFPHRYMVDKAIFSRRVLTEGGIMVDASGSMSWNDADLKAVLALMPAVWVGTYSGFNYGSGAVTPPERYTPEQAEAVIGRICILAKNGRFAEYQKAEAGATNGNDVDVEALTLLSKWPKPRLWLSDGQVTGGVYYNKSPIDKRWLDHGSGHYSERQIIDRVHLLMKRYEIYRVANKKDMIDLLRKRRVTVYRSCVSPNTESGYPPFLRAEPVTIQL